MEVSFHSNRTHDPLGWGGKSPETRSILATDGTENRLPFLHDREEEIVSIFHFFRSLGESRRSENHRKTIPTRNRESDGVEIFVNHQPLVIRRGFQ